MPARRALLPAVPLLAALALAGCAADSGSSSSSSSSAPPAAAPSGAGSPSAAACSPTSLKTRTAGTLTLATDKPAYEPWYSKDDPTNGQGYESAVGYAVAGKLGYAKDKVTWVRQSFNSVIAPGPKSFDVDLNEVSITEQRRAAVDFSSGYYDVTQAVVARKAGKAAQAKSVADLKGLRLGAQVGTTSYTVIGGVIGASQKGRAYDTNDLAVEALKNGQIDALVLDLPTAFYATSAQIDDGVIVGQLPQGGGQPEQFGAVLDKGSPLTACVTQAVDGLRSDGTLTGLQKQFLTEAGAPELR